MSKPVGPPLLPGAVWSRGIFSCFFPVSRSKGLENSKETSELPAYLFSPEPQVNLEQPVTFLL